MPVPTPFPYLHQQPGYDKRLRKAAGVMRTVNRIPATTTAVRSDDVWVVHSTTATAPATAALRERLRQTLVGDKNYFRCGFERELSEHEVKLLRPARTDERERPGVALCKLLRQVIESINETCQGQDLERDRGRTQGAIQ
ncbi:hypothetical protein ABZT06_47025 [Streptomyces sp. NPDC005483]|uniref:hypothetical protein n=1 Tax=Streptomyces sp. NPDC005483 TaxID=3154882 RepID=UPI00339FCF32